MKKPFSFVCLALVVAAGGCKKDATFTEPMPPMAAITWLNAVSDTGQLDMRVIDITSNAQFMDADFRAAQTYPLGIEAGQRRVRVFMSGTSIPVASTIMLDTTFTVQADEHYSFYVHGFGRTGQTPRLQALITTAAPPAVVAGRVHVRVINLAPSLDPDPTTPVDAWIVARGGAALAGPATIANTGTGGISSYVPLDTGRYRFAITANGTTSPILFQTNMLLGAAGSTTNNPIGGTLAEGSAITAVIVPRSVPGSRAPNWFSAIAPIATITTTGTTAADTIATAVTAAPHGLVTGDTVVLNGAVQAAFRGTVIVTVVDPSTFTFRTSGTPQAAASTGYPFWFPARFNSAFNGRPIATLTSVGTTATVVTPSAHNLATNDIVAISGATDPAYNGSFAITVVNTTTFTYTTNGTPAASPAAGAPVFRVGDVDFTHPNVIFLVDRRPANTVPAP